MSNTDSNPRYGTCRHCGGSIVSNSGKAGWYHVERNVRPVPAHFAEPHNVMDRSAS